METIYDVMKDLDRVRYRIGARYDDEREREPGDWYAHEREIGRAHV